MSDRGRLWTFVAIVAGSITVGVGYLVLAGSDSNAAAADPVRPVALTPLTTGVVVVRTLDRHSGRYGEVAIVDRSRQAAPVGTGVICDRVTANPNGAMCLVRVKAFGLKYDALVLGPDFRVLRRIHLEGVPSRTRMSPDGRYAGMTSFVAGHSYAELGTFSTQTVIVDRGTGRVVLDLEDLDVTRDGRTIDAADVNYWGVTFAPTGGGFYATLATGGKTYLIRGRVGSQRARVLRENVECPSVSPDGRRVAYKKRVGNPPVWRFHVLELASMRDVALAETRPIDDQLEWLDGDRLLYRVDDEVWSVRADGRGAPRLFLRGAESPAVIRG
jgi:hypothetical protein